MSLMRSCSCGFGFPVEPEDQGFTVYCPSCGRECAVPEAVAGADQAASAEEPAVADKAAVADEAAVATLRAPRASIFTAVGQSLVEDKTVHEVACLCGQKIDVGLSDYGGTVYCPSCGSGVPVGEQLQKVALARAEVVDEADPNKVRALPRTRFRLIRSPKGLAAMAVIFAALTAGAYALVQNPAVLPENVQAWIPRAIAPPPPRPPKQSAPADKDEKKEDASAAPEEPPPEITLEAIEQLLKAADKRMALVEAQIWKRILIDEKAAPDDPRLKRLDEVIARLRDQLRPKNKPAGEPAHIASFRKKLDELRQAIKDRDLKQAQITYLELENLINEHRDDLAGFSVIVLKLKRALQTLELETQGADLIEGMLKQAGSLARTGQLTDALVWRAKAVVRARTAHFLTPEQQEHLQQVTISLREPLRLAEGRRAVEEAEAFHKSGDAAARDRQIQRANALLPGLPAREIDPLLARVRALGPSRRGAGDAKNSRMGQLAARENFEASLQLFAEGQTDKFVDACLELKRSQENNGDGPQYDALMANLVFDQLEPRVMDLLDHVTQTGKDSAELADACKTMEKLSPWKHLPRYRTLDAAIRQRTGAIAKAHLDQGKKLAAENQLDKAQAEAALAKALGDPVTTREAETLQKQWQADAEARASLDAQKKHWEHIQLLKREKNALELARQIDSFKTRYPQSQFESELFPLEHEVADMIDGKVKAVIIEADEHRRAGREGPMLARLRELAGVPIPVAQRARHALLTGKAEEIKRRDRGLLVEARRAAEMSTEDQVLLLLKNLPRVLESDPNNAEALQLLEKARAVAAKMAQDLLQKGEEQRRYIGGKSRASMYYRRVIKLDPDGPSGKKAQQRLRGG